MADQSTEENVVDRSLMDNITEKLHVHHSSSSSDDDDEKPTHSSSSNKLFGRQKSVHSLIGGGKAADLVLWKNKQTSASFLVGATVLWILFEGMEYPLLTFVCHVLILSLVILFIWINSAAFLKSNPIEGGFQDIYSVIEKLLQETSPHGNMKLLDDIQNLP